MAQLPEHSLSESNNAEQVHGTWRLSALRHRSQTITYLPACSYVSMDMWRKRATLGVAFGPLSTAPDSPL
jgi:hypothetical protein